MQSCSRYKVNALRVEPHRHGTVQRFCRAVQAGLIDNPLPVIDAEPVTHHVAQEGIPGNAAIQSDAVHAAAVYTWC